ncbi:hypothetical protein [Phaeocystidibacter marisrubri]|uniref:DUF1501 domain-containing protein n=1 Tax=Phaeocystidibacter marisrubri TaxID=1577780 RepID=A0A6L3ZE17_9FLAO|nr:hypothetical protein [Phaeocystidibacter marisrubri]KAB2815684.1 hypothetical protein F8C82_08250 [Phaeocystidibacter marisrubri]GGH65172.1 hypothetical protein GCM10011318_01910 [Phaeocystidibacter marisrubri]
MNRREFIKKGSLTALGVAGLPYILPSGRLFAATGARKVNHVVFCLFAGGVRNWESVQKAEGNLMPNILSGSEAISSDLVGSMSNLPSSPLSSSMQSMGTLFREFRFSSGPTGHYNGHTTALTGQHTSTALNLRAAPDMPTIFELYRKHNSPSTSATNAWWVSHSNNLYPLLNYSTHPNYGPAYGANQIAPTQLFQGSSLDALGPEFSIDPDIQSELERLTHFSNSQFDIPFSAAAGLENTVEGREQIQAFLSQMVQAAQSGQHINPWSVPSGMNGDMLNVFYAEEILKEFKPELLVVNMFGVDVAHTNFTGYCDNLRRADWAVAHLWNTIQNTPGMANDTLLIVAPEIGRNANPNTIVDVNGRAALDHTTDDAVSREIFCLMLGPAGIVQANQSIQTVTGESIDIVPTIADALGFGSEVSGILPGRVLQEAYV